MGDSYDGADDIERAWREGLTPDPLLTVSEWADRHRVLMGDTARDAVWKSLTELVAETWTCARLQPGGPAQQKP